MVKPAATKDVKFLIILAVVGLIKPVKPIDRFVK